MQAHQHKSLTYGLWKQGHCAQRPHSASAAAIALKAHASVLLPRAHSEYDLSLDDRSIIERRQDAALLGRCASSILKLGIEANSLLSQDNPVQQQHIFAGTIRQATSGRGLTRTFYSPNSSIQAVAAIETQPRAAGNCNKPVHAAPVQPDRASAKRYRTAAYRRGTCPGLLQGHTRRSAAAAAVKQAEVPAVTLQRRTSLAAAASTDRRKGSLPATWSSADQFKLLSELKTFFAPQYSALQRRQQVLARAVAANSSSSTDGVQQHNDSTGGASGEQLLYTTAEASAQYLAALSDAALLARESLKFDPSVLAVLNEFWRLVKKHIIVRNRANSSAAAAAASTQIGLSRDDYIALSIRMQKVVTAPELFTQKRARAVAVAEWQHDSNGHSYLDRNRFCNAMFQAAAMWATADTPQQYSAFLWMLLDALSFRERNGSRRWRWEPRAQYRSANADDVDHDDSNNDADNSKRQKQRSHRTAAVTGVAHNGVASAAAVTSGAVYNKSSSADPLLWSSRKRLTVPRQPPITRTRRVHPMLRCMHKREQCYTGIDAVACDHTARCDLQYRVLTDAQQCTAERIGDTTVIQPVLRIEARVRPHRSPVCTQQLHALYTSSSGSIAAMRASQGIHSSSSDECCGLLPVSPRDAHILQQLLV
jgi:hypothetical protein